MIGIHMIYFFFDLCMYVRGFASYIFVRISFLGGGGFCVAWVFILWSRLHMVHGYNSECTPGKLDSLMNATLNSPISVGEKIARATPIL